MRAYKWLIFATLCGCANNAARLSAWEAANRDAAARPMEDAGEDAVDAGMQGSASDASVVASDSGVGDATPDAMDAGTSGNGGTTDASLPADASPSDAGTTPQDGAMAQVDASGTAPSVSGVIFTEVMARPKGGTDNEWLELYNTSDQPVDLKGCVIARGNYEQHTIATLVIAPKGYAVLARKTAASETGVQVDEEMTEIFLLSSETITLTCGASMVDSLAYSGTEYGAAWQLDGRYVTAGKNDDNLTWCSATAAMPKGENLGTPRAPNRDCDGVSPP